MAMHLSKDDEFKASKGWYNNFKKRYALEIKMKEKLNNPEMQGEFNIEVK